MPILVLYGFLNGGKTLLARFLCKKIYCKNEKSINEKLKSVKFLNKKLNFRCKLIFYTDRNNFKQILFFRSSSCLRLPVFGQFPEDLVGPAGGQLGDGGHQGHGHECVVLHAHLDGGEDAEVGAVEVPQQGHVQLPHGRKIGSTLRSNLAVLVFYNISRVFLECFCNQLSSHQAGKAFLSCVFLDRKK